MCHQVLKSTSRHLRRAIIAALCLTLPLGVRAQQPSAPVSADLAAAINRRGDHMAFDTGQLDPGNPVRLYANIDFHFARGQRLSVGSPVEPVSGGEVKWRSELDAVPIQTVIAAPSRNNYDTATVTATCQIQSDGSIVCVDLKVIPLNGAPSDAQTMAQFQADARSQLKYQRAASTFKNGDSTAGKWVNIEMTTRAVRARRD